MVASSRYALSGPTGSTVSNQGRVRVIPADSCVSGARLMAEDRRRRPGVVPRHRPTPLERGKPVARAMPRHGHHAPAEDRHPGGAPLDTGLVTQCSWRIWKPRSSASVETAHAPTAVVPRLRRRRSRCDMARIVKIPTARWGKSNEGPLVLVRRANPRSGGLARSGSAPSRPRHRRG